MLAGDGAADALRLARDVGALAVALPEWAPCIGCRSAVDDPGATRSTSTSCTCSRPPCDDGAARLLRLAAFWHDVGKPHAAGRSSTPRWARASRAARCGA